MQQYLQPYEGIVAMISQTVSPIKIFINTVCVVAVTVLLVSCAESVTEAGQGAGTEQLPTTSVEVFPDGFFSAGYTENYAVTGIDDKGTEYAGTFKLTTGDEEVFNGIDAVPVISELSYAAVINGMTVTPITIVLTEYFSVSLPRQYLGSINAYTALILTAQGPVNYIPETVVPDSSGIMASSVGSDSSQEDIDWFIQDNAGDSYILSFVLNHTDGAGGLINREVHTYTINETGDRLSWSLTAQVSSLSNTLRFSGTRI